MRQNGKWKNELGWLTKRETERRDKNGKQSTTDSQELLLVVTCTFFLHWHSLSYLATPPAGESTRLIRPFLTQLKEGFFDSAFFD